MEWLPAKLSTRATKTTSKQTTVDALDELESKASLADRCDKDQDQVSCPDNAGQLCLVGAVAAARRVCKMQFVVGAAPVCYGLPVIARNPHTQNA